MVTRTLLSAVVLVGVVAPTIAQPAPRTASAAKSVGQPVPVPTATKSVGQPVPVPAAAAPQPGAATKSVGQLFPFEPAVDTPAACPDPCGPTGQAWVQLEWLYWATSGQSLPPLVTAAPASTPRPGAGALGAPGTTTLYGGDRANNDFRSGFRLTGGLWLDDDRTFGVEGDFFFLGRSRDGISAGSDGSQVIARPFFNAATGTADAELVSYPGVLAGAVTASATSDVIGGGVSALCNLCCDPCGRADAVFGYRYFGLTDEVTVAEDLTALAGAGRVPAGFRYQIVDRFRTENAFHGAVIGAAGERRFGHYFVAARATVALGVNRQTTEINGSTVITPPGGPATAYTGGLLAQPTNIGRYERSEFAVLPELGLRAGVALTDHARVFAGYNFVYLSNVARAGDQIDPRVNPALLPPRGAATGPLVPAYEPRTTDFWIHGISVGLDLRF